VDDDEGANGGVYVYVSPSGPVTLLVWAKGRLTETKGSGFSGA